MPCALCGGPIRRGQFFISVRAFVPVSNAFGQQTAEMMVMEDGRTVRDAHYGCVLKRCPELIGAVGGDDPHV